MKSKDEGGNEGGEEHCVEGGNEGVVMKVLMMMVMKS